MMLGSQLWNPMGRVYRIIYCMHVYTYYLYIPHMHDTWVIVRFLWGRDTLEILANDRLFRDGQKNVETKVERLEKTV